jgi:hypothetical protein
MATAMAASAATTPRDLVRVLTWLLEFFYGVGESRVPVTAAP